jgi:hypothetical protein
VQPGLRGRRIALFARDASAQPTVRAALERAGAEVQVLTPELGEEAWHSGMYAGLVCLGAPDRGERVRLVQLAREMVLAEKPVALFDASADDLELDGGGVTLQGSGDADEFARRVVAGFADRLEEAAVDEMSDLSFPASDPPSVSPGIAGRAYRDGERRP